jgi:hypothetical protein
MTRILGVALLGIGWAIATPSLAHADDPKSTQDAQARFDEGIARAMQHDFEGARLAFTQAYAVLKKYDILFNLALAEEKSGHTLDALEHFKQLAGDAQGSADDRMTSHRHAIALAARTGHIDVAAPPGAGIVVDGATNIVMTPLAEPIDVLPGSHKVEAKSRDHTYTVTVNATRGDVVKANFLDLIPADTPMLPDPHAPPPAPAPTTTAPPPPVDTGTPPTPHDSFWTGRTITVVALGGAAVVGIGAGILLGTEAHSHSTDADTLRATIGSQGCANSSNPSCAQLASDVSSANSDSTASKVLYVAGGVLAVGAIATWFLWPKAASGSGASAMVVPIVGRDGGGMGVVGRF